MINKSTNTIATVLAEVNQVMGKLRTTVLENIATIENFCSSIILVPVISWHVLL